MNTITQGTFRAALLLLAMAGLFVAIGSLFGALGMAIALAMANMIGFWSFWHSGPAIVAATGLWPAPRANARRGVEMTHGRHRR
jgi:hypothetical protein